MAKIMKLSFLMPKDWLLYEADETKDRNGQKIKGINASASHIDEADELSLTIYH